MGRPAATVTEHKAEVETLAALLAAEQIAAFGAADEQDETASLPTAEKV